MKFYSNKIFIFESIFPIRIKFLPSNFNEGTSYIMKVFKNNKILFE